MFRAVHFVFRPRCAWTAPSGGERLEMKAECPLERDT